MLLDKWTETKTVKTIDSTKEGDKAQEETSLHIEEATTIREDEVEIQVSPLVVQNSTCEAGETAEVVGQEAKMDQAKVSQPSLKSPTPNQDKHASSFQTTIN